MDQKALKAVIDEWSDAVAEVLPHTPPDVRKRLTRATGNLLEAFASTATELASHTVMAVLAKLQKVDDQASSRTEELEGRVEALEGHPYGE